jgi:hypothetical protein
MFSTPGKIDVKLDLFKNHHTNIDLHPHPKGYFRRTHVPLLVI